MIAAALQRTVISLGLAAVAWWSPLEVAVMTHQAGEPDFTEPGHAGEQAAMPWAPDRPWSATPLDSAIERHRDQLLAIDGVHGISHGRTAIGDDAIRIDVEREAIRQQLPTEIEGYPVEVVVIPGGFDILPA